MPERASSRSSSSSRRRRSCARTSSPSCSTRPTARSARSCCASSAAPDRVAARTRSEELRGELVETLEGAGWIRSAAVRDALLETPRELFLPEHAERDGLEAVYRDEAIVTKRSRHGMPLSSSSQPAIMALMLEQLELAEGMRILEIGAGTGYNAALLARLVGPAGSVTTVDVDPELARGARRALRAAGRKARVVVGDGRHGFADRAPYDRIVVTASAEAIPRPWLDQLAGYGALQV